MDGGDEPPRLGRCVLAWENQDRRTDDRYRCALSKPAFTGNSVGGRWNVASLHRSINDAVVDAFVFAGGVADVTGWIV